MAPPTSPLLCLIGLISVVASGDRQSPKSFSEKQTITWVDTLPPEWLLPGMEHLRHGINLVTGVEAARPLFQFTYGGALDPYDTTSSHGPVKTMQAPGVGSGGQVFWYADQLDVRPKESCEFSSSMSTYHTTTSYAMDMSIKAGISASVASLGAMSASAGVSAMKDGSRNGKRDMFLSSAQCEVAAVEMRNTSCVHPRALAALQKLPTALNGGELSTDEQERLFEFFREFGTHYYHTTDLGGELQQMTFIDKSTVATSSSADLAASLKASFSAGVASGGGHASVDSARAEQDNRSGSSSSSNIVARGGEPGAFSSSSDSPAGAVSWGGWAATLPMNPIPINFKLQPVWSLPAFSSRRTALKRALRAFMRATSTPGFSWYWLYLAVSDQCHEEACSSAPPPLPSGWKPLVSVAEGAVASSRKSKGVLDASPGGGAAELNATALTECVLVCTHGTGAAAKPCTRPDNQEALIIRHRTPACSGRCHHPDCTADVQESKACSRVQPSCSKAGTRPATAAEADGASVKPAPPVDPSKLKPCDVVCQRSSLASHGDCVVDGLLMTARHRGTACSGACSSDACRQEISRSRLCPSIHQSCNSRHFRAATLADVDRNKVVAQARQQRACALVCQQSSRLSHSDCIHSSGSLAAVAFTHPDCAGKCGSAKCAAALVASGKCPAHCDSKATRVLYSPPLVSFLQHQPSDNALAAPTLADNTAASAAAAAPRRRHRLRRYSSSSSSSSRRRLLSTNATLSKLQATVEEIESHQKDFPAVLPGAAPAVMADLTRLADYPTVTIRGDRSSIREWKLGARSGGRHPFIYGSLVKFGMQAAALGELQSVTLTLPPKGSFRMMRLVSEATGKEYVFDTRQPPTVSPDGARELNLMPLHIHKGSPMLNESQPEAPFFARITDMFVARQNRYEFVIESTSSRFIDSFGDVTLLLTGERGAVTVPAPFYQERFWGTITQRKKLADRIRRGLAQPSDAEVASCNSSLRFANFATVNGPRLSFFAHEGASLGALKTVALRLSRLPSSHSDGIELAPPEVQREVAVQICHALLNVNGPQTATCENIQSAGQRKGESIPNLDEVAANFDYDGITVGKCKQVVALMEEGVGGRYACKFDSRTGTWRKYAPAVGGALPHTTVIHPRCGRAGCRWGGAPCNRFNSGGLVAAESTPIDDCERMFPYDTPLFTAEKQEADTARLLTVKSVKVLDWRRGKVLRANFRTTVSSREAVERELEQN